MYFNKKIRGFFILVCFLTVVGCGGKKSVLFKKSEKNGVISSDSVKTLKEIYSPILQKGDRITIKNLNNEAFVNGLGSSTPLQISYEIDENGNVKLPEIGEVTLGGLKIKEAEELITETYKRNLLADPQFVVEVISSTVTFLGEFTKQGNFNLQNKKTSLVEVLGEAQGFTSRADKSKIMIIRGDKADPEIIKVDLTNLASLKSPKLYLESHDIIYVQPRKIFHFTDNIAPIVSYVGITTSLLSLIVLFSR